MPPPRQKLGLESLDRFVQAGIWDSYYSPSWQERGAGSLLDAFEAEQAAMASFGIARHCVLLHVGAGTSRPETDRRIREHPDEIRNLLARRADRLLGVARLTGNDVAVALRAIEEWIAAGPMVGIFLWYGAGAVACSHPNFDPIVRRAAELGALIIQLNWFNTLEEDGPDISTPSTLAVLAARHPDITFISSHAGGEWEKGIRAVRAHPNILVETSGFDPTAGFIEMAVRELGAERIVFGSHLPSRCFGTEYSKILGAAISDREKEMIFGENLRRLLLPILRRKGMLRP